MKFIILLKTIWHGLDILHDKILHPFFGDDEEYQKKIKELQKQNQELKKKNNSK